MFDVISGGPHERDNWASEVSGKGWNDASVVLPISGQVAWVNAILDEATPDPGFLSFWEWKLILFSFPILMNIRQKLIFQRSIFLIYGKNFIQQYSWCQCFAQIILSWLMSSPWRWNDVSEYYFVSIELEQRESDVLWGHFYQAMVAWKIVLLHSSK